MPESPVVRGTICKLKCGTVCPATAPSFQAKLNPSATNAFFKAVQTFQGMAWNDWSLGEYCECKWIFGDNSVLDVIMIYIKILMKGGGVFKMIFLACR